METAVPEAGLAGQIITERQTEQWRITPVYLSRWFPGETVYQVKPAYGPRLLVGGLSVAEVGEVKEVYGCQLQNQTVTWHSVAAYLLVANQS